MSRPDDIVRPGDDLARSRRRGLAAVGLAVLVAAMSVGTWWWLWGRWQASTNDAYVNTDLAQVSALTTGTVKSVQVHAGQQVREGYLLVELDDTDARITLAHAEAALAKAVRGARGLSGSAQAAEAGVAQHRSDVETARASLAAAESALAKARSDLERQVTLSQQGFVSPETLTALRTAVQTAQANRDAASSAMAAARAGTGQARAQAQAAAAQVDEGPLSAQPDVTLAAAAVRQAVLELARTRILAPVDGVAGPLSVHLGERVSPDTPVLNLVPLDRVWVDANFKETDLDGLRVGQPVTLTADAYGSGVRYTGTVAGVTPATGSTLSLLPAQNATGNWIKVVQRVTVRIWLDRAALADHPLQVGLSMNVTVDLHDRSGARLGLLSEAAQPLHTTVYDGAARDAETLVQRIVAANAPRGR